MWNGLKQRLGLKRMACCGDTWSPDASPMATRESTAEDDRDRDRDHDHERATVTIGQVLGCDGARQHQGMSLAAALEEARNSHGGGDGAVGVTTLMRLIEETDGVDLMVSRRRERRKAAADGGGGTRGECDWLCCVCMERDKGAAFIPCGHAYCRECSRELWLGRGSCPICNRSIVEILDLF